jgi:hypothetical protein
MLSQKPVDNYRFIKKINGVKLKEIKGYFNFVESYKIAEYQTAKSPYEGHYSHYNTKVLKENNKIKF